MKSKKIKLGIAAAVLGVLALAYIRAFVLGGQTPNKTTAAAVDGRISYNADKEIEAALQTLDAGCAQADIAASDSSQAENTVALGFYGLSDSAVNDEILRLLADNGCEATFFLTGLEAADNEDFVQSLISSGNTLGSYGLKGVSQAQNETRAALVKSFAHSQKVLTTLTDRAVKLLYGSSTIYTAAVRQAAYASGYSKVVFAKDENLLDYTTFESEREVGDYLSGLGAGTLLMIRIDGENEQIPDEPTVTPDTPAVDKQPDADILQTAEEAAPAENALQLTKWLVKAMKSRKIQTVAIDSLSTLTAAPQEENGTKAMVYRSFLTDQNEVALALWGLPDSETLTAVTALLAQYDADATFFVTETELVQRGDDLTALAQGGFALGNGGESLADCAKLLEDVTAEKLMLWLPISRLPLAGDDEEAELRQLAAAEGYAVAAPQNPEQAQAGAFYGLDLSQADAPERLEALLTELQKSGLAVCDVSRLMQDFGQIPSYTEEQLQALRTQNNGKREQAVNYVYTTERALSFLFFGVSNRAVMQDLCARLAAHDATATFFVTLDEMQQNTETIEQLLSAGHEIGIAYIESDAYPAEFEPVMRYLNSCVRYFAWRYHTEPSIVFMPYGEASDEVKEAVSAMGLMLAGQNITIVKSAHKALTIDGISEVLETDLSKVNITRGSQVYFNANFYAADQALPDDSSSETVCGAMLDAVFENFIDPIAYQDPATGQYAEDSRYKVKTCSAVRGSKECYTLTADLTNCDIKESNTVISGMTSEEEQISYIAQRYIGTPSVSTSAKLPGFSWKELQQLDKTGRFTNEPTLFLTFDDWGTDASVNHLLYVLEKYGIKATFYVRTNYVAANPNLLRAIAQAGHEVASHSQNHIQLAQYEQSSGTYRSLTDEEAAELRADAVKSYEELYTYIGDVEVEGLPSLSKNFRPPTLAVSKIGLTQILDTGFDYIVSGDFPTQDYEAASVEELLNKFKNGTGTERVTNGSILVMHMLESACYTAQALDQMIPLWQQQGYSFERVDVGIAQAATAAAEGAAE